MMLRLRVELADRPGSLARLAGVLAAFRADVAQVTVMHRGEGIAVDDVWLTVDPEVPAGEIYDAVAALSGTRLIGRREAAAPVDFDAQLDFLAYLFAAPQRGLEAFVDMLPSVVDADWAAVRGIDGSLAYDSDLGAGLAFGGAPVIEADRVTAAVTELAVTDGVTVLVGRAEELPWHPAEVRRISSVLELAALFIRSCAGSTSQPMTGLTEWFVQTPALASA